MNDSFYKETGDIWQINGEQKFFLHMDLHQQAVSHLLR